MYICIHIYICPFFVVYTYVRAVVRPVVVVLCPSVMPVVVVELCPFVCPSRRRPIVAIRHNMIKVTHISPALVQHGKSRRWFNRFWSNRVSSIFLNLAFSFRIACIGGTCGYGLGLAAGVARRYRT